MGQEISIGNPQPAEIPLKKPLRTVLTSGATSVAGFLARSNDRVGGLPSRDTPV